MIELDGYDTFNQKLEPVHFLYDGLLVAQGSEFGGKTPIIIKNSKMVKYTVILKAVSFSDESIWQAESLVPLSPLPENKPQELSGTLLEQLQRDLSKQGNKNAATFSPQTYLNLWQCGCGSWQYIDTPCLKCRITQKALSEISELSVLENNLEEYQKEQERLRIEAEKREEEMRIVRAKAKKEQQEKEEAEKRRRLSEARKQARERARRKAKARKKAMIGTALAAVVLVAGYFGWTALRKTNKYNNAVTLLKAGSYEDARIVLNELGDYKDCLTLLKQANANEMWDNQEYAAAYDIYVTLPTEYQIHTQDYESSYQTANEAEKSGNYEKAATIFDQLGNYKDSAARYAASEISRKEALAQSHMAAGDYDSARDIYLELGYAEEVNECLYLLSDSQAADQPWLAYEGFLSLGDYKDSAKRASDLYGRRFEFIGNMDSNHRRTFQDPETSNFGLLDSKADVAVQPEYSSIILNDNHTYTVKKTEKYGVIDRSGKVIIPIDYNNVTVQNGIYWVKKESVTGALKADGTVLIPAEYQQITSVTSGYEVVKNGKKGLIAFNGKTIISPLYDSITTMEDGRFLVKAENVYGVISEEGKTIIETKYESITHENTNTYSVINNGKYGIIKYDGTIVHEANMDLVQSGSNDGKYLMFQENGLYGFMDASTFAVLVAPEWKGATKMTDGYAYIRNNLDKWGVISCKGNVTVSPQWDYIVYYEDCGYALRSADGSKSSSCRYLMDNRGKEVCDLERGGEYLGNGVFRNTSGTKLYSVETKTSYSFTINGNNDISKLRMLTTDLLSGYFRSSSSGYNYQYGVISVSQKKLLTDQAWEEEIVSLPSKNTVHGKYGWIGANGKDLVSPDYDFMMSRLVNGYIVAGKYNDRGNLVYLLIDPSNGKIVAKNLGTRDEAFNYFGKPSEDMSTHGQIMWVLTNAGFDAESASSFIQNCMKGLSYSAKNDYESIEASFDFKRIWSNLESDIRQHRVDTEEKLLDKLIEYGLE